MLTHATDLIKGSWRYATGLRGFLSKTIDLEEAKAIVTDQLQNREESFLQVLQKGIYGNPRSPYRRLLEHAGYQFEDVQALVREQGLEATLSKLYDDGVYVSLDEFKGRAPIRRPGLEFPVTAFDFDNPLSTSHFQGHSGGSRGGATRVPMDFDFMRHESAATLCNLSANDVIDHPVLLCQPAPPSMLGLGNLFRFAHAGRTPIEWISPTKPSWNRQGLQGRLMALYTYLVSLSLGRSIPRPKYHPQGELMEIVQWLAEARRRDEAPIAVSMASQAVRICLAAEEAGEDISGTVFYGSGEPFTEAKHATQLRVGASAMPTYAMHESGYIALKCGASVVPDDMHVLREKLVVLPRRIEAKFGPDVQALFHTTLLTTAPKLMLNVESGDYAVIEERDCGCLWQQLGFTTHIHSVRSYEKLTSEGVMFMGSMLHELLEETLPTRFGGGPLDYQRVEEEEDGVTRVSIIVSPRIGAVDETEIVNIALESLGFADWSRRQADLWRQNNTLRIQRREPYATRAGKTLPLHVLSSPHTGDPASR